MSVVEVWLTQKSIVIRCMIVNEDESTRDVAINSLNMRGAQREVTALLLGPGYTGVGRWKPETSDRQEFSRRFRQDERRVRGNGGLARTSGCDIERADRSIRTCGLK